MKIAVIGAGAIGGLVAGYLKLKGEDVTLIGHPDSVRAVRSSGLIISGVRGDFKIEIDAAEKLNHAAQLLILATKTQDVEGALKENRPFLREGILLTTQNGIAADELAVQYAAKENLISSIVMFGATCLQPGEIVHNFEGDWIIGKAFGTNDAALTALSQLLNKIFPVTVSDEIKGMKYLKIFVNANNCLAGILGVSMQEAFSDLEISKISIAIWKEGLEIVKASGINLISLPDFPLERLQKLTALPTGEAAKIFSGIMASLSKEPLYGSILQSIKRNKPSEIDYLNGEFVNLAKKNNANAALNEKLVEMVHQVEARHKFFTKDALFKETQGLFN